MKKVLIIGHFWPYRRGSIRVIGLAKYLREFGWEPIILTAPLSGRPDFKVRCVETDYRNMFGLKTKADLGSQMIKIGKETAPLFKKILGTIFGYVRMIAAYPDEDRYWKPFAINSIDNLFAKEKISAIISVWPMTSHIIAQKTKEKYAVPWVADFPELWSQNCDYPYGFARKIIDRSLEKKTLKDADVMTTISLPMADNLKKLHNGKIVFTIVHGFDPDIVSQNKNSVTDKFTITYTGNFYPGKRDPLKFFAALSNLLREGKIDRKKIEVRFYSSKQKKIDEEIKKYNLSDVVRQCGMISLEDSLNRQRESQVLLFLDWEDEKEKGVYSGKIFEYLAAKRPILSVGGSENNVVRKLLQETKAGVFSGDIAGAENLLRNFYLEYQRNGKVEYKGDDREIEKYSNKEVARKFADVLNNLHAK